MPLLDFILWNIDPELPFVKAIWPVRWYGLLFAAGFIIGQKIMLQFFKKENIGEKHIDQLLIYVITGIVIGARLGHCIFYDFHYYFIENPLEIIQIQKGGLASHGGGIGLVIALTLYYNKNKKIIKNVMWLIDRLALLTAITGCLIRFGNLMNSEIIGKPSDASYSFLFAKNTEMALEEGYDEIEEISISKAGGDTTVNGFTYPKLSIDIVLDAQLIAPKDQIKFTNNFILTYINGLSGSDQHLISFNKTIVHKTSEGSQFNIYGITRHPAQLYESISCLILFVILLVIFKRYNQDPPEGLSIGLFLTYVFTLRFCYEFLKENQVAMEDGWTLNMGQILSIPMVIIGLFFLIRSFKQEKINP